jgi:hypothetical protein
MQLPTPRKTPPTFQTAEDAATPKQTRLPILGATATRPHWGLCPETPKSALYCPARQRHPQGHPDVGQNPIRHGPKAKSSRTPRSSSVTPILRRCRRIFHGPLATSTNPTSSAPNLPKSASDTHHSVFIIVADETSTAHHRRSPIRRSRPRTDQGPPRHPPVRLCSLSWKPQRQSSPAKISGNANPPGHHQQHSTVA